MLLSLLACAPTALQTTEFAEPAVVVLVIDGVRVQDSLGEHSSLVDNHPSTLMPRLWRELLPQAARPPAVNPGVTITGPAHCALLSGRRQLFGNFPVHDEAGLYRPELPVLSEALQSQLGWTSDRLAMAANTRFLEGLTHSLQADALASDAVYVGNGNGHEPADDDSDVIDALKAELADGRVRFALANLHAVDRSAHFGVENSHPQHLRALDDDLADFWIWLQEHPSYADHTTLVVVSDHGRHDTGEGKNPWREHGDSCGGCRHVPLLLLGPDVVEGPSTARVTLEDLGVTLAAFFDVDLPWARGRVAHELFERELPGRELGAVELGLAGGLEGELELLDDPDHRARVVVDGVQLSSPEAFDVEALAMEHGTVATWACFRELHLSDDGPSPWVPRCFQHRDGAWAEAVAFQAEVGPTWEVALGERPGGGIRAAWVENINGVVGNDEDDYDDERVRLRVATGDGASWEVVDLGVLTGFPTGTTVSVGPTDFFVAWSAAEEGSDARHKRRIQVGELVAGEASEVASVDLAPLVGDTYRAERPALARGGVRRLAAVVTTPDDTVLALANGDADGWWATTLLDAPGPLLPQVTPVWVGDQVLFGVQGDGEALACLGAEDRATLCVSTGSPRLSRIVVDGDRVDFHVDHGVGAFGRTEASLALWEGGLQTETGG